MSDEELQQALRDAVETMRTARSKTEEIDSWEELTSDEDADVIERAAQAMAHVVEVWRELETATEAGVILPPRLPE